MKIAIHQPHYFPWIGYFDKMAKVDTFVLLDEVQFEKGSQMIRNRVIDTNGGIKYITISADTKDFLKKEYRDLRTKDLTIWTKNQINAVANYYRKALYFHEIAPLLEDFLSNNYQTICEWTCSSIEMIRGLLDINTPLIMQSDIQYDRQCKKSDLVRAICTSLDADTYFSGRGGSVNYLDVEAFKQSGIKIVLQDFCHPEYSQVNSKQFMTGVSILDMLFNCGIERTKQVFWENVYRKNEFEVGN